MASLKAVREAGARWLQCPANTPEEEEAWQELYALLNPRPRGSRDVTADNGTDEPVILP